MPELPEVETIARQLRARQVEGREVISVVVNWAPTVGPISVDQFCAAVCGVVIQRVSRVGKWLVFELDSGWSLLVHLRMSGAFSVEPGAYDRVVLQLSGGMTLYYSDPRKFGRWTLVEDPQSILSKLGPDALGSGFSCAGFAEALLGHRRKIKPLLLDQSIVAGLGNIYADEALWESQIHPERPADSLSKAEIKSLYASILHVLQVGVENRGTSLGDGKSNYRDVDGESGDNRTVVSAYGRHGTPCERCGALLVKTVVAQRGSHFCPRCQHL